MPLEIILIIVAGFIVAFILAVGVGANDVANAFGTSVGAKVLTLKQACSKVTDTVRKGIVDISIYDNRTEVLMLGNIATLSGSCLWLILATVFKMPVSGTHSVVGATIGFALVASGTTGIQWKQLIYIVASWFVSPVLSGIVSCGLFYLCKYGILTKKDPIEPGLRFLPMFYAVTIVVNLFSIFFEGPKALGFHKIPLWGVLVISLGAGIITAIVVRIIVIPFQRRKIIGYNNNIKFVKKYDENEKLMMDEMKKKEQEKVFREVANKRLRENAIPKHGSFVADEKIRLKEIDVNNKSLPKHGSFVADDRTRIKERNELKISFKPNSQDGLNNDLFDDAHLVKRERSQSMIAATSTNIEAEIAHDEHKKKRFRSKSESATAEQRKKMYSGTINQLVHKRFVNADKSMILNIEMKYAASKEQKLQQEGRPTGEIVKMTRDAINDRPEQRQLFSYLQILSAAFGGFAHGGNDVSNAIGPLVSIWILGTAKSNIPENSYSQILILLFGGIGITVGLWIWGRRVIKTMGEDLAKITPSTGFCIELGAATTVLAASNLGLPISTTHCKVGSVVTVGWARARKNVDWKLFSSIFLAWVLTLPVAGGISAAVMAILMNLSIAKYGIGGSAGASGANSTILYDVLTNTTTITV
ncbi:hypothetical protein HELRODRAFT_189127 [Helobdella robusta]|uniref:Phosphate transporter n=1 Tax=Helobdella robusta TaxID=6412 RepID=T1FQP6_HELRO|nr:hypothetical protein HELRODRAFT_189127 [Helobdella robusta]ESN96158.1 hypothetical protein HELRODRAFT_189127 [Helobdella robusta]